MEITDIDALLDRHRDRFRRLLQTIVAEEAGVDPFRVPLDEFQSLSDDARAALVRRAAILSADRVERELRARGAAWIALVGDEVVAASADPRAIPSAEDVLRLGEPRGLVAYLFEAPLIEELPPWRSAWAALSDDDRYPTVPLVANPNGPHRKELAADLDTGSHATLLDANLVAAAAPTWFTGRHLGEFYSWTIAAIDLEVTPSSGDPVKRSVPVRVVREWKTSPFTRINPRRQALVGRDVLRLLGISVALRARAAETDIVDAERAGST
jgi:hypothetical protein